MDVAACIGALDFASLNPGYVVRLLIRIFAKNLRLGAVPETNIMGRKTSIINMKSNYKRH